MAIRDGRSTTRLVGALLATATLGLGLVRCSSSSGSHTTGPPSDAGGASDSAVHHPGDGGDATAKADASDSATVDAGIPCDDAGGCPGTLACCSSFCVDMRRDPRNCGSCNNDCTASEFCTGTTCVGAVFANVCDNTAATVVDDQFWGDNEAGVTLGMALASCPDAGITVVIVPQTQAGVLVAGDAGWRPNTGVGNTLVAGGGGFGQLSVTYLDGNGLTPVYLTNDGTTSHFYQRSTGLALVTALDVDLTTHHDFFALELAVEPQSGTLCLVGEGIYGAGTAAAGYYGGSVMLSDPGMYPTSFYVYEWTDTNGDGVPNAGDAFALVAQGS